MNYSELIDEKQFEAIKNYLKVDIKYDDELIKSFLDAAALQLVDAIDITKKPSDFINDSRYHLAVKKICKEEYEHRGLSADTMRHTLVNGVENIIHQLRVKAGEYVDNAQNE